MKIRMWRTSLLLASTIFLLLLAYVIQYNQSLSLLTWSQAVAATAGFMIGISFAMSGIGYWWDFLDSKVAYRKYFGLVGFWLALLYSLMLFFVDPEKYWFNFWENAISAEILLGLGAMAILTFMALISNNWAMQKLTPQRWRVYLRFGYLAYTLLIVRGVVLEWDIWIAWIEMPQGFPPPRLILSIFASTVIFFRGSIFISKQFKKYPTPPIAQPPPQ